jgi:hypothetical protein
LSFKIFESDLVQSDSPYELLLAKSDILQAASQLKSKYHWNDWVESDLKVDNFILLKNEVNEYVRKSKNNIELKHQNAQTSTNYSSLSITANYNSVSTTFLPSTLLEFSNNPELDKLIKSFGHFALGRSRIALQDGNMPINLGNNHQWHNDASIFFNLRVNIPIVSNSNFIIQVLDPDNQKNGVLNIQEIVLEENKCIAYQTENIHRPFCKKANETTRINIIITIFPWLAFDVEKRFYYPNKYFGKIHPFDLLKDGKLQN